MFVLAAFSSYSINIITMTIFSRRHNLQNRHIILAFQIFAKHEQPAQYLRIKAFTRLDGPPAEDSSAEDVYGKSTGCFKQFVVSKTLSDKAVFFVLHQKLGVIDERNSVDGARAYIGMLFGGIFGSCDSQRVLIRILNYIFMRGDMAGGMCQHVDMQRFPTVIRYDLFFGACKHIFDTGELFMPIIGIHHTGNQ